MRELEKEWAETAASFDSINATESSFFVTSFLENGFKYIDKLMDDLFKSESMVPKREHLSEDYYSNLKVDMEELILKELEMIRSKVSNMFIFHTFSNLIIGVSPSLA